MNTTGNTILLTGGTSGIGRALAEALHGLGNQLIITGRSQARLQETTAANPGMKALTLNMEDAEDIKRLAEQVTREFPNLNVLINNAGIMRRENLLQPQEDLADAMETVTTNLLGPIRLTAALLPLLKRQPHAVIMNSSSGLAFLPMAAAPTYSASKAAIHVYTESLRYQLKDTRIQVLELVPPYVRTALLNEAQSKDPNAMPLDEFIAEAVDILKNQPNVTEVLVQRVYPLRFAAEGGQEKYQRAFQERNDFVSAAAAHQ